MKICIHHWQAGASSIKHRLWKFFVDATYDSGRIVFLRFFLQLHVF